MTNTQNMTPAFGNEEDIILNLSGVINDFLLKNKPINFIVKHYFYAKCLVAELAKANIPYHVFYLGSGVRHITTNIKDPVLSIAAPDRAPTRVDEEKRNLWLKTFGTAKVRTSAVVVAIRDDPTVTQLFDSYPKLNNKAVGHALGHLHRKVNWLQCKPTWIAEEQQSKFFWYVK